MSIEKIITSIKSNNNFVITAHTNPEGDALGSELAFQRLLNKLGKRSIIVNDDRLPYGYDFMPGAGRIKRFNPGLVRLKFDCLGVLDCSDLSRSGKVSRLASAARAVINIDHHVSNSRFADVNWVDPDASSCSELVYRLYKKMRVPFDKASALALYVGILTDTGSFRYANTTSLTHGIVSELLRYNINAHAIYKKIYADIPYPDIRLLAKVLPQIKRDASGRVAWFELKKSILRRGEISFDLSEHLLSFARSIKDIEVAVLFKENLKAENEIRVNFRSQGKINVNKIAAFFGGGGHRAASGATISGSLLTVSRKVLRKIAESF